MRKEQIVNSLTGQAVVTDELNVASSETPTLTLVTPGYAITMHEGLLNLADPTDLLKGDTNITTLKTCVPFRPCLPAARCAPNTGCAPDRSCFPRSTQPCIPDKAPCSPFR